MKILLGATLAAAAVIGVTAPAHAEDKRPCVSKVEYEGTNDVVKWRTLLPVEGDSPTRHELEERWDVLKMGVVDRVISTRGAVLVDYPMCGYTYGDAFISVVYDGRAGQAAIMVKNKKRGAIGNGAYT